MDTMPFTELLDLQPLPVTALKNPLFEQLFSYFKFFNPIQTQVFFSLYQTKKNILIGAPTGSGKTIMSELAILNLMKENPEKKTVYIAPLKALVRERLKDWAPRFAKIKKSVVELSGDFTPDIESLKRADIIVTTPEKWDGITRSNDR
jgi:activating signal cointegrator complex subunit 3